MGLKLCTETRVERAQFASFGLVMSCGRGDSYKRLQRIRLVEPPAHDGDLVAMCMMSVGSQCGGCVCGRCVCDVYAWIPCRLGYG